jgi:hypothetical protein
VPTAKYAESWKAMPFGEVVAKVGCSTGLTIGLLLATPIYTRESATKIPDGPGFVAKNQLEISPRKVSSFAEAGDSGAIVWDRLGRAIGLLHCVLETSLKPVGIATPIFAVMQSLSLEICQTPISCCKSLSCPEGSSLQ